MKNENIKKNKGMIYPMIVLMVFIFVVFIIVLQNFNVQNRRTNYRDVMRRQALYVAEAGMQHALLKLKVLQTDCFDALMNSQLKNPRFNFGQDLNKDGKIDSGDIDDNPRSSTYNPGPIYITISEDEKEAMLKDPQYSGNPEAGDLFGDLNIFIRDFISDIKFDAEKEVMVTSEDKITFKYGYEALSVKILGEKWDPSNNKGYISAEFIIEGYAYDKNDQKVTDTLRRTYKIEKSF